MAKVKVVIRHWLSTMMGTDGSGPVLLDEETNGHSTVGGVLLGVAARNKAFGEAVFDASLKDLSGRITIALNNRLLGKHKDLDIVVKDGDVLTLFPTIEGG
jgi:molybdopterin converting factor small subunit